MKLVYPLLFTTCLLCLTLPVFPQTYADYHRQGVEAYKEKDYEAFLEAAIKADSLRPNHPVLLYNLAAGYALNGHEKEAFNTLEYRANFYAAKDFFEDEDFKSLHDLPAWIQIERLVDQYNTPRQSSSLAFQFDFPGFHPEGIAFDSVASRFFISDVRNGLVYSFSENGTDKKLVLDLTKHGYWSAMGLGFDSATTRKLWVTTSALPNFSGYDESLDGRAAVLCFDLESGELLHAFSPEGSHFFGDLTVARDGTVYISDSIQPVIYQIRPDQKSITELIRHKDWWNLQGLALSEDPNRLYVSDYITGIYRVDLLSKDVKPLLNNNELLRGSDGIYLQNGRLILLQNGTVPKRTASIQLDPNGDGIANTLRFPDQGLSDLNEPTLGTIIRNQLYFIANSPWPYYNEQNEPNIEEWPSLKVFKMRIE